jgi:hypothetical protein
LRERGRFSRYELVQSHVAAALSTGGSIAEGRQLLERLSQGPLPPSISQRLTSWQTRFGALTLRPAVLIEARSQVELDNALGDERVRRMVRARLGPTAIEVPAADALELAMLLRETGHLPQIDAALRLSADPRRAYASLVDQQVLEWLLVSLLAFQTARPEQLAQLEGASSLVERLEHQFPPERLRELRAEAARLAGELHSAPPKSTPRRTRRRRTR